MPRLASVSPVALQEGVLLTTRRVRLRSALTPRIEAGIPTKKGDLCCRKGYIGIFYDADRVTEAASVEDEKDLRGSAADA